MDVLASVVRALARTGCANLLDESCSDRGRRMTLSMQVTSLLREVCG